MPTYTKQIAANFGASKTGLAASVQYTVTKTDGTTLIAATNAGVAESPSGSGIYTTAVANWDSSWAGQITWTITGQSGIAANDTFDAFDQMAASAAAAILANPAYKLSTSASGQVQQDMAQAVPTSNAAQTVGDALNAARAQGFGKWVLSGTSLTLYAADGTTAVRTFTLDRAAGPTSRT